MKEMVFIQRKFTFYLSISQEKHIRSDDGQECTFQPDVSKSVAFLKGEKVTQTPLHERLGEIMKQKQDFLQRLRMEAETNNKDMVFKPTINEHVYKENQFFKDIY